jgi:hypothetical protein
MSIYLAGRLAALFLLVAILCSGPNRVSRADEIPREIASKLQYLPKGCDLFATVDFEKLRKAKAYDEIRKPVEESIAELQAEFRTTFGFEITEMSRFTIVGRLDDSNVAGAIIQTTRRIDRKNLLDQLRKQHGGNGEKNATVNIVHVDGKTIYVVDDEEQQEVCVIDDNTLAVGAGGRLRKAVARGKHAIPDDLMAVMQQLDYAQIAAIAVCVPKTVVERTAADSPPASERVDVDQVLVHWHVTDIVRLDLDLLCRDEEAAKRVEWTTRFFVAALNHKSNDEQPDAADNLSTKREDGKVLVAAELTPKQWNAVVRWIQSESAANEPTAE